MIKYKIRDSDWLTLALIIVNFNHFFIQPAPGLNQAWHMDGYDKLKPFGFPIHGAIDGLVEECCG